MERLPPVSPRVALRACSNENHAKQILHIMHHIYLEFCVKVCFGMFGSLPPSLCHQVLSFISLAMRLSELSHSPECWCKIGLYSSLVWNEYIPFDCLKVLQNSFGSLPLSLCHKVLKFMSEVSVTARLKPQSLPAHVMERLPPVSPRVALRACSNENHAKQILHIMHHLYLEFCVKVCFGMFGSLPPSLCHQVLSFISLAMRLSELSHSPECWCKIGLYSSLVWNEYIPFDCLKVFQNSFGSLPPSLCHKVLKFMSEVSATARLKPQSLPAHVMERLPPVSPRVALRACSNENHAKQILHIMHHIYLKFCVKVCFGMFGSLPPSLCHQVLSFISLAMRISELSHSPECWCKIGLYSSLVWNEYIPFDCLKVCQNSFGSLPPSLCHKVLKFMSEVSVIENTPLCQLVPELKGYRNQSGQCL